MSKAKRIFITGASSGFGRVTALLLLEQGYSVFAGIRNVAGRNEAAVRDLQKAAADLQGTLHVIELDVLDEGSVNAAIRQALELEGGIDVLVNNAGVGFGLGAYAEGVTMEQFIKSFDVNVFGVQRMTRAILPAMRAAKSGLILNISSTMGRVVLPYAAVYTASKYALEGLSESYRYELKGTGVETSILEPGGFGTDFWSNREAADDVERVQGYGDLADAPGKTMWGGVDESFGSDEAPNPRLVADAILTLIETPAGKRPLRTVVDPATGGEGPRSLNESTDKLQAELLEAIGMGGLL